MRNDNEYSCFHEIFTNLRQLRKEQLELEIMSSKASCIKKLLELEVGDWMKRETRD